MFDIIIESIFLDMAYSSKWLKRLHLAYKRGGIISLLHQSVSYWLQMATNLFLLLCYKAFTSERTFRFQGENLFYFYHHYGTTWKNERSVEIPIVWSMVNKNQNRNILEVGNVLSYRFRVKHDILDKYEIGDRIINEDVVDYCPSKRYDLIVSISTIEHVGWDESPKDAKKILKAIENLRKLLAPNGEMIVTLPLGYNPEMDRLLRIGLLRFDEQYYLKRTPDNRWEQVLWDDVKDAAYDKHVPTANAIVIGKICKGQVDR